MTNRSTLPPSATAPALLRRYPAAAERIPWLPLGCAVTPVETVHVETATGRRTILVKRDDLTAEPYGGNKVRKLEFILADAAQRGAQRLITAGAAGSHHALATTLYGRANGFAVTLVLFPQARTDHVRDVLLMDHGAGASLRFIRRMELVPLGIAAARIQHWRERPYIVAPGGSDPIGTLGYVSAGLELAEQIEGIDQVPAVYVAAGTLGTVAGLALGLVLAGRPLPIRAVRITSRIVTNERALRGLIEATAARLRDAGVEPPDVARVLETIELHHDQLGEGYGRETHAGRVATRAFAAAGLRLDPTYTAKAAAALLAAPHDGVPMFLHTLSAAEPLHLARAADLTRLPARFRSYLER